MVVIVVVVVIRCLVLCKNEEQPKTKEKGKEIKIVGNKKDTGYTNVFI